MQCRIFNVEITRTLIVQRCSECQSKCHYYETRRYAYLSQKVDPFELARLLKNKKMNEQNVTPDPPKRDIFENVIWLTEDDL